MNDAKKWRTAMVAATFGMAASFSATAAENMFDGQWHYRVTPYVWAPDVHGSANYANPFTGQGRFSADIAPGSYLENLDFAAFVIGEARKGDWTLFADYMFVRFSGDKSATRNVTPPPVGAAIPIDIDGSFGLEANVLTLAGGYTAWREANGHLDVFGGARLLNVESHADVAATTPVVPVPLTKNVSSTTDKWDGVVGVKGRLQFPASEWFVPYYADVGWGSNNRTYQGTVGVGYHFAWGDVILAVRTLSYKSNDDRLDLRLTGPGLGVSFTF